MNSKSKEEVCQLIKQLRDRLKDVIANNDMFDNDFYLYRWLIQNRLNVDKTEKLIRESIEWRKANNVDELADQDWASGTPGLEKIFYIHTGGFTKAGQPVTTLISEGLNLRSVFQKYSYEAVIRYTIKTFVKQEKLLLDYYKQGPSENPKDTEIIGEGISNLTLNSSANEDGGKVKRAYNHSWFSAAPFLIISYKNYSLWNATCLEAIQFNLEAAKIQMNYFPTISSSVYIVNLNKSLSVIIKMVKPLLNSEAMNMEFFDTDKSKWSAAILKHIEPDQLQAYFGGSKLDEYISK